MRTGYFTLLLAFSVAGCHTRTDAPGCAILGPEELLPEKVRQVRLGMTKVELENLLGQADYSPTEGQFYFSTGGDCPLEEGGPLASCGLVVEFRNDDVATDALQSCWWGAIGE